MNKISDTVELLRMDSPDLEICARWRHEAFLQGSGVSVDESVQDLRDTVAQADSEAVLVSRVGGTVAGFCLLVRNELDPPHTLSPWLASLYVTPEFRQRGIATALVKATENHARGLGFQILHLYTWTAEELYLQCGWRIGERFDWHGKLFVLMHQDL